MEAGKAKGYFSLFLTSTLWGTTWIVSKIGIRDIPALQMAAYRQLIAGSIFVLFFLLFRKIKLPSVKQWGWITIMGILMFVFANGLSTWSLKYIPAGMSALIGALYPLSVVIIERIFFKTEKIKPIILTGFIVGFIGIAVVFYENAFHQDKTSLIKGISLSMIAMLSWSFGTVFIARNKVQMNPYYATGWQMVVSSFILIILAYFTQPVIPIQQVTTRAWLVIFYLVIFGSIVTFIAFIYSMKKLSTTIASLYAYVNPLIALLSGAWILGEKLTLNILWGAILTLTGIFLVNYGIRYHRKVIAESEM